MITGKRENFIKNVEERCTEQLVNQINKSNKTVLITVGSLRDIAAVLDNDNLIKDKIESIYIFAGDNEGTYEEYNVSLDPEAYDYVLSAEIAIYLIPCVQGFKDGVFTVGNDCSYFVAGHSDLLRDCDDEILKWFVYERNHAKENFEEYELTSNECERFFNERRNLWCSSILPHIVNDNYEHDFELYRAEKNIEFPYYFKHDKTKDNIYRFKIKNRDEYVNYSIWLINHILKI